MLHGWKLQAIGHFPTNIVACRFSIHSSVYHHPLAFTTPLCHAAFKVFTTNWSRVESGLGIGFFTISMSEIFCTKLVASLLGVLTHPSLQCLLITSWFLASLFIASVHGNLNTAVIACSVRHLTQLWNSVEIYGDYYLMTVGLEFQ